MDFSTNFCVVKELIMKLIKLVIIFYFRRVQRQLLFDIYISNWNALFVSKKNYL